MVEAHVVVILESQLPGATGGTLGRSALAVLALRG